MSKLSTALHGINWQEVWMLVQTLLTLKATHDPENGVDHTNAIANVQTAIADHDVSKTPEALAKSDTATAD